jgi:serine/threonine-protein kinase
VPAALLPLEAAASCGQNRLQEALMKVGPSQPVSPAARATPADLARLSALLDEALDLPAAARAEWLENLRAESAPLATTLAGLLARAGGSETADLLDRGPRFATASEPPAFGAGDTVGPYRPLRPIGQGGMGEVWLAERAGGQLKRRVALKLPMLGVRRTVLVQRFERERDILASLEHPHIARLCDAGVADDGQPYLALEYIEGAPIDRWCREQATTVGQRVRLMLQVADAVACAHGRLVLHRPQAEQHSCYRAIRRAPTRLRHRQADGGVGCCRGHRADTRFRPRVDAALR